MVLRTFGGFDLVFNVVSRGEQVVRMSTCIGTRYYLQLNFVMSFFWMVLGTFGGFELVFSVVCQEVNK